MGKLCRIITSGLLLLRTAAHVSSQHPGNLGPGRGAWQHATAEDHGLSSKKLEAAATLLQESAPFRYCLVVVKDGKMVHESYFVNSSKTRYRTQSLGKTMIATMFGTLVQQGLLDLDKPLEQYGVPRNASWNLTGVDYWPTVTARHLLSQAGGYGKVPPGTFYSYDSDEYIQQLSALMRSVAGVSPTEWAQNKFAKPMGLEDMFNYDGYIYDIGDDISTGGGQMMSCGQIARVGQLLVNKGEWLDADDKPFQLIPESYVKQQMAPSFPEANSGYGFLTWLQFKPPKDSKTHCCAPRWAGHRECSADGRHCASCCEARPNSNVEPVTCSLNVTGLSQGNEYRARNPADPANFYLREGGAYVVNSSFGDGLPMEIQESLPDDLAIMQGENGAYAFVVPSRNLTVVTMGMTRPQGSNACWKSYDDAFGVAYVWAMIADSVTPSDSPPLRGAPESNIQDHVAERGPHAAPKESGVAPQDNVGSCQCDCPPGQGFGFCFNVGAESAPPPPSDPSDRRNACQRIAEERPNTTLGKLLTKPQNLCPRMGSTFPCDLSRDSGHDNGTALCQDVTRNANTVLVKECALTPGTGMTAVACDETVDRPMFENMVWRTEPCVQNPYYPTHVVARQMAFVV